MYSALKTCIFVVESGGGSSSSPRRDCDTRGVVAPAAAAVTAPPKAAPFVRTGDRQQSLKLSDNSSISKSPAAPTHAIRRAAQGAGSLLPRSADQVRVAKTPNHL